VYFSAENGKKICYAAASVSSTGGVASASSGSPTKYRRKTPDNDVLAQRCDLRRDQLFHRLVRILDESLLHQANIAVAKNGPRLRFTRNLAFVFP